MGQDLIVLQRIICLLDLLHYELPELWPFDETSQVCCLCYATLERPDFVEDAALHFHVEALLGRMVEAGRAFPPVLVRQRSAAWRAKLQVGDEVDAMDIEQTAWYEAQVVDTRPVEGNGEAEEVRVHFMGWAAKWDAWINLRVEGF